MKKGQNDHPERELEVGASGPARSSRIRKGKQGASLRNRAMNRKGNNAQGGIHERGNKRVNW